MNPIYDLTRSIGAVCVCLAFASLFVFVLLGLNRKRHRRWRSFVSAFLIAFAILLLIGTTMLVTVLIYGPVP